MPTHILVVDDEPAIAEMLTYALATDGFAPVWCATGWETLDATAKTRFGLAIYQTNNYPMHITTVYLRSDEALTCHGFNLDATF